MNEHYAEYLKTHGTPAELREILGPSWGICRATPRNRERYARCITRKQYDEANRLAVARRIVARTNHSGGVYGAYPA